MFATSHTIGDGSWPPPEFVLAMLVFAAVHAAAGAMVLLRIRGGRPFLAILSVLNLAALPIGTALGGFTLIMLGSSLRGRASEPTG
ncbi:MAG: hypothetical protein ACE5EF_08730 [Dehalococcoidia bacterium]